jgi:hypothetical protein
MGFTRFVLAGVVFMATVIEALAGASSVPTNYTPDPALRTASRDALEARIRKACMVTQARVQNVSETSVSSPCGCYASRTLRALNESEIQAYRYSGVFNDGARDKALAAIDACKLQRPI